ncbi:MAG: lysine exporter LysO family protein [Mariniphaga sp.]
MKGTLILITFFASGILLGISGNLPHILISSVWSNYALYVLMFLAGIGIGADRKSWHLIRAMHVKIFLVPAGIIIGTFAGATVSSLFLPALHLREILAVAAGFGYYSLSSIIISDLHSEALGVVALASNIFREIITLLTVPLLVKYFGNLAGIASGGATSMDTTLPVISKYSGKEYTVISLFNGIILTILVPFLVTFILKVGKLI